MSKSARPLRFAVIGLGLGLLAIGSRARIRVPEEVETISPTDPIGQKPPADTVSGDRAPDPKGDSTARGEAIL